MKKEQLIYSELHKKHKDCMQKQGKCINEEMIISRIKTLNLSSQLQLPHVLQLQFCLTSYLLHLQHIVHKMPLIALKSNNTRCSTIVPQR